MSPAKMKNLRIIQAMHALDRSGHTISLRNLKTLTGFSWPVIILGIRIAAQAKWILPKHNAGQYTMTHTGKDMATNLLEVHKDHLQPLRPFTAL